MTETAATICAWAEETFGEATMLRQLQRVVEEVVELSFTAGDDPEALEECADVVICLARPIHKLGGELPYLGRSLLQAAINAKMQVNRARTWKVDGEGCAYHIKEQPTDLKPSTDQSSNGVETPKGVG